MQTSPPSPTRRRRTKRSMIEKRLSLLRRPRDNSLLNNKWKRNKLLSMLLKRLERRLRSKRNKDLMP